MRHLTMRYLACLLLSAAAIACEPLPIGELAAPLDVSVPASTRVGSWQAALDYSRGGVLVVRPGSLHFDGRSVARLGGEAGLEFLPVDRETRPIWFWEESVAPTLVEMLRTHGRPMHSDAKLIEIHLLSRNCAVRPESSDDPWGAGLTSDCTSDPVNDEEWERIKQLERIDDEIFDADRGPCSKPRLAPVLVLAHPDTPMSTVRTIQVSACLAGAPTIALGFAGNAPWPPDARDAGEFLDSPTAYPMERLFTLTEREISPRATATPTEIREFTLHIHRDRVELHVPARREATEPLEYSTEHALTNETGLRLYRSLAARQRGYDDSLLSSTIVDPELRLRTWVQITDFLSYTREYDGNPRLDSVDQFELSDVVEIPDAYDEYDGDLAPYPLARPWLSGIVGATSADSGIPASAPIGHEPP